MLFLWNFTQIWSCCKCENLPSYACLAEAVRGLACRSARLCAHWAGFRPRTEHSSLCVCSVWCQVLVLGAGKRRCRRWGKAEEEESWDKVGVHPGELGGSQELRKTCRRCAVQVTLVCALFQPCIFLCLSGCTSQTAFWRGDGMWRGSGLRPKGVGAASEVGSGRVGRRWPPGQAFTAPLETSKRVPETGIFTASP